MRRSLRALLRSSAAIRSRPQRRRPWRPDLQRLEPRTLLSTLSYTAPSGNGTDDLTLRLNGSFIQIFDNNASRVVAQRQLRNTTGVVITGANHENDHLTIDYAFGGFFTLADGVTFHGGAGGFDSLAVRGTGATSGTYRPSATTPGNGTVTVSLGSSAVTIQFTGIEPSGTAGPGPLNFSGVEPLTASGMTSFTFVTPNSRDEIRITSPIPNQNRIDGTSDGVTLVPLTFFHIATVTLDTAQNDGSNPDDRIEMTAALVASNLAELKILGGVGNDTYQLIPTPGRPITVVDTAGANDTLDLRNATEPVTLILDDGQAEVTTASGARIDVVGTIETGIGSLFDDTLIVRGLVNKALYDYGGNNTFIDDSDAPEIQFFDLGGGDTTYFLDPGSTITVTDDGGNDTISFVAPSIRPRLQPLGFDDGFSEFDDSFSIASHRPGRGVHVKLDEESGKVFRYDEAGTLIGHVDILGRIENVQGTPFDDIIEGNSSDGILDGGGGNDIIRGGTGDNYYIFDEFSRTIVHDPGGIDTFDFSRFNAGIDLDLTRTGRMREVAPGSWLEFHGTFENVIGGQGNNTILGNSADNILIGWGGDDTLVGGAGDDVLVGGDGDDRLNGSDGRDIVIGGRGADRITGAGGEDILIAGWTIYDTDLVALNALRAKWTTGQSYEQRVASLTDTSADYFLVVGLTVFNDGDPDTLTGGQARDWFFIGPEDTVTDWNKNERLN